MDFKICISPCLKSLCDNKCKIKINEAEDILACTRRYCKCGYITVADLLFGVKKKLTNGFNS